MTVSGFFFLSYVVNSNIVLFFVACLILIFVTEICQIFEMIWFHMHDFSLQLSECHHTL